MPGQSYSFNIDHPIDEDTSTTMHNLVISDAKYMTFNSLPTETSTSDYVYNKTISNLVEVDIAEGITELQAGSFAFATNLTSITLPESLTSIQENVFFGCENLQKVVLKSHYSDDLFVKGSHQVIYGWDPTTDTVTLTGFVSNFAFDYLSYFDQSNPSDGYQEKYAYKNTILLETPNMTIDEVIKLDSNYTIFGFNLYRCEDSNEIDIHIKDSSGKIYKIFCEENSETGEVTYTKEEV